MSVALGCLPSPVIEPQHEREGQLDIARDVPRFAAVFNTWAAQHKGLALRATDALGEEGEDSRRDRKACLPLRRNLEQEQGGRGLPLRAQGLGGSRDAGHHDVELAQGLAQRLPWSDRNYRTTPDCPMELGGNSARHRKETGIRRTLYLVKTSLSATGQQQRQNKHQGPRKGWKHTPAPNLANKGKAEGTTPNGGASALAIRP